MVRIALCALLLAGSASAAPLSVAEALGIRDGAASSFAGRTQWSALTYYLQGSVESLVSAQRLQTEEGRGAAFCPPEKASYGVDEMMQMIERAARVDPETPVGAALAEGYMRKYPCAD